MNIRITSTLICFCIFHLVTGQSNTLLDSIIIENKYEIQKNGSQFEGTGIDYIIAQAKEVQFLGLTENYNTEQVPPFTSFLFQRLHEQYGLNYLALEKTQS